MLIFEGLSFIADFNEFDNKFIVRAINKKIIKDRNKF